MKLIHPNILIIGTGSSIGYTAVRQLHSYSGIGKVYVGNINRIFPASVFSENIIVTPDFYGKRTSSKEDYLDFLFNFVVVKKIDILISCSIFEIQLLSENREKFKNLGCRIIIEKTSNIQIFYDKLETINYLRSNNLAALNTEEIIEQKNILKLPNVTFPFLIKPRFGYGSNGIAIIKNVEEFLCWTKFVNPKYKPYIAQTFLEECYEEYSCTCTFKSNGEVKDLMVIARKKIETVTTKAEYTVDIESIEPIMKEIIFKFSGMYVLNFQFKMIGNTPFIFEINPRFGAAEAIRIKFGQDMFFSVLSEYCIIGNSNLHKKYGTVFRVYDEILIPNTV